MRIKRDRFPKKKILDPFMKKYMNMPHPSFLARLDSKQIKKSLTRVFMQNIITQKNLRSILDCYR